MTWLEYLSFVWTSPQGYIEEAEAFEYWISGKTFI